MTLLDAAVIAFLILAGFGGYRQGLIRGLTRSIALVGTGVLAFVVSSTLIITGSIRAVILRTLALIVAVLLLNMGAMTVLNRVVPRSAHESQINRLLGVIPAVLQALIIAAIALGLAHRLALNAETQRYIADGLLTGRLMEPVGWIERSLAGLP
jgi:uncharacterized membrane protein required for colicin V production